MGRLAIVLTLSTICCTTSYAQPSWARNFPSPDLIYTYFVGVADGKVSAITEEKAFENAVRQIAFAIGGVVSSESIVRRHDEVQRGESTTFFSSQAVIEGVQKIEVFSTEKTTWVLVGIPTRVLKQEKQRLHAARSFHKNVKINITGSNENLDIHFKACLIRYFTVVDDSQSTHTLYYTLQSELYASLGQKVAYQFKVNIELKCAEKIVAAKQFIEFGKGWNQAQAEEDGFQKIAMAASLFLASNVEEQ